MKSEPARMRLHTPDQLRMFAHPARFRAIDELFGTQKALTATHLAHLAGISPSSMSYHLRELEKCGMIVRAGRSSDGRERLWKAAAEAYRIAASEESDVAGREALIDAYLGPMRSRMVTVVEARHRRVHAPKTQQASDASAEEAASLPESVTPPESSPAPAAVSAEAPGPADPFTVLATGRLQLTEDELACMRDEVREVFDRYEKLGMDRGGDRPTIPAVYMWSCLPESVSDAPSLADPAEAPLRSGAEASDAPDAGRSPDGDGIGLISGVVPVQEQVLESEREPVPLPQLDDGSPAPVRTAGELAGAGSAGISRITPVEPGLGEGNDRAL